jgi:16S rRNA processing protein RimM
VGLRGEVDVAITSDAPERFAIGAVVLLAADHRPLTVASRRRTGRGVIVSFEEVVDRNAAEALKGAELVISAGQARPLEEGEYWDHDLIGCEVITTDGRVIGRVEDVLHAAANDVLVVRGDRGEDLIPLTSNIVMDVRPRERITIEPIPGLLEE